MPPRGIPCDMCGGMFFAGSIKIHQKQCAIKMGLRMTECGDCHAQISMLDLKTHLSKCPAFRKYKEELAAIGVNTSMEANDDPNYAALVPCIFCGRTFSPDRVQTHMRICKKTGVKKRAVFRAELKRQPTDATGYGLPSVKDIPTPERVETNWRQKSADLRVAVFAGRSLLSGAPSRQHVTAPSQLRAPGRRSPAGPSSTRASRAAPRKAATPILSSRMKSPLPLEASHKPRTSSTRSVAFERRSNSSESPAASTPVDTHATPSRRVVTGSTSAPKRSAAAPSSTQNIKAGTRESNTPTMRASEPARAFTKPRLKAPMPVRASGTTRIASAKGDVSARGSAIRPTSSGLVRASGAVLASRASATALAKSRVRTAPSVSPGNKKNQWGAPPPRDGTTRAWGREMCAGGGGGIGNSNATSADNPLVTGFR
eukprot:GEMP01019448.1.p1 GENE.GEMP01019448.1~~GEMP01019448.1.p1  ORF type:complete len:428 (+),score=77.96 GEMP01019448.1:245-1528(+)